MKPDFLVVGHVVQDLHDSEWRAGGAVTYAGLLAHKLGLRTAILTSCADDFPLNETLPGIDVHRVAGADTTQIRNVYTPNGRKQWVPRRASPVLTDSASLPSEWRESAIVLLGPVAGEVEARSIEHFPNSTIGVGAQGWLRGIGPDGEVAPISPADVPDDLLESANAIFVSEEDLPGSDINSTVERWARQIAVVALTHGDGGADIAFEGEWHHIEAFPAETVDPTGAGDVFAAAFLIRHGETNDPREAARFASAAAACVVEGEGPAMVPDRRRVEERLQRNPEIVAKAT